jgi:hypothetical protein
MTFGNVAKNFRWREKFQATDEAQIKASADFADERRLNLAGLNRRKPAQSADKKSVFHLWPSVAKLDA